MALTYFSQDIHPIYFVRSAPIEYSPMYALSIFLCLDLQPFGISDLTSALSFAPTLLLLLLSRTLLVALLPLHIKSVLTSVSNSPLD
jgi:hypothetical protein